VLETSPVRTVQKPAAPLLPAPSRSFSSDSEPRSQSQKSHLALLPAAVVRWAKGLWFGKRQATDEIALIWMVPSCSRFQCREFKRWVPKNHRLVGLVFSAIPIVLILILSGFKPAHSSFEQRFWNMMWLVVGLCAPDAIFGLRNSYGDSNFGIPVSRWLPILRFTPADDRFLSSILYFSMGGVGAVGGFIVVGKMLKEYGSCEIL
jgi:hypothetical protein